MKSKQVELAHKKRLLTLSKKNNKSISEYMSDLGKRNKGISKPTSGFGATTIGADGLTGHERAVIAGKKGGRKRRKFVL